MSLLTGTEAHPFTSNSRTSYLTAIKETHLPSHVTLVNCIIGYHVLGILHVISWVWCILSALPIRLPTVLCGRLSHPHFKGKRTMEWNDL